MITFWKFTNSITKPCLYFKSTSYFKNNAEVFLFFVFFNVTNIITVIIIILDHEDNITMIPTLS